MSMNFLAGVSLLKQRKESKDSSVQPTQNVSPSSKDQEGKKRGLMADVGKAPESKEGANGQTVTTSVRSTRWSSALMSGVDPKVLYGNKRFSEIYDSWDSLKRKPRKPKASDIGKSSNDSSHVDDATLSEDDGDRTIEGTRDMVLDVLTEIGSIVTTLITKMRYSAVIPVKAADGTIRGGYGTRSMSAQLNQKRMMLTGGVIVESRDLSTEERINNAICDDAETLKGDLEEMLQKGTNIVKDKRRGLLPYYIAEYIALRANYYYRMLRNMKRLEQHMAEYAYVPKDFITALIDIYRCAALAHLEMLRRLIPKKIKRAGVLDFRAWRCGLNKVPVTMQNLNSVLQTYQYNKIKEKKFLPQNEITQTPQVSMPAIIMPAFSMPYKAAASLMDNYNRVKPSTTYESQRAPFDNMHTMQVVKAVPKAEAPISVPVVNRSHPNSSPVVPRLSIQEPVSKDSSTNRFVGGRRSDIPNIPKNPVTLFNEEHENWRANALKEVRPSPYQPTPKPALTTNAFGSRTKAAVAARQEGLPQKRTSMTRQGNPYHGHPKPANMEACDTIKIPHLYDQARADNYCPIKIPRIKPAAQGDATSPSGHQMTDDKRMHQPPNGQ